MLAEREAVKRESCVLLASAANDKRLADALAEIEKLNIQLEQECKEHSTKVFIAIALHCISLYVISVVVLPLLLLL